MIAKTWRSPAMAWVGLGLAALLLGGAGLLWLDREQGGSSNGLLHIPLAADKSLGTNADLSLLSAEEREGALAAMEAAGFRWLRQRFPWEAIEPEPGVFDWSVWDEIVASSNRHKIQVLAVLDGSPAWARAEADVENSLAPPVETRHYGDFVAAFAERYGDRLGYYQIWDEPNIAPHWGAREIDPTAYARLLREGAIRIRSSDPGAVILAAALAPNIEPGGANMNEADFMAALYQQGSGQWFDAVAAQLYSFEDPVQAPPDPGRLNWQRVVLLRQVMEDYGDAETAVWAVSTGLADAMPGAVTGTVEQARLNWPWLGPMLWAAWSPGDNHGQYALVEQGGAFGEAYHALGDLALAPAVAWPGSYPADHPSGSFAGDWRVTSLGADIGGSGDRLTIPFRGSQLDLVVRRGNYRAFLYVTVDGKPANALPQDAEGRAYVVLYDPLQAVDIVTLAHDLSDEHHVAEIVAERGWGQWTVAGWSVSRGTEQGWPWLILLLGLAGSGVLVVTVYKAWPQRDLVVGAVAGPVACYRALDDRLALVITAGGAVLLYVMLGTIPTLAALVLLAFLLLLRPGMGLPLIAFALPFYQLGRPLLGKNFSMVEILTFLTAVGWVANRVWAMVAADRVPPAKGGAITSAPGGRHLVVRLTPLDWGMLVLVVIGGLSLLWAEHLHVAAREFRTVVLEAGIYYALLRVMVPARCDGERECRDVWRIADGWVLGAAIVALIGLFHWMSGRNLIEAEGVVRARAFYGSPNNLALYLGKVLPLGVTIGAFSSFRGNEKGRRLTYGLAALVMALAILLTYSRGAWLVGVPVSLLFVAAMRDRRILAVVVGMMVVLAVVVLIFAGGGRLMSLLDTTGGTTFFRLQLWQSSWAMVRDHPLTGVGLDNFLYQYRTHYVLPTAWEEFDLSHPHNLVLDFWLRLGLPGLLAMLWLLLAFFRQGWQAYRRLPEGSERLLVLGLMGGMVNFVAHGLVDNAFFLVDLAFSFALMLALVQILGNRIKDG